MFVLVHFFFDGADKLGASKFQARWEWSGGGYIGRSGGGGSGGRGGGCSCRFMSGGVGLIRVVSIRVFWAATGHVALLATSETASLLPVLDAFLVG